MGSFSRFALLLLAISACHGTEQEPAARMRKLAVEPEDLPESCHLKWAARPTALMPKKDAKLLTLIANYWFGPTGVPKPDELRCALSSVYSPPGSKEAPLTLTFFDFTSDTDAAAREEQLLVKFKDSDEYRVQRRGSLLFWMSATSPVTASCANGVWDATLSRVAVN